MFLVNGLAGDAEGVADLLPRPSCESSRHDVLAFQPVGQSAEGGDRPQPGGGIVAHRGEHHLIGVHAVNLG